MELIPLHKFRSQYTDSCIELLNEEWPRSVYARNLSLSKSCDELPASLILVNSLENGVLLGHSKLCKIPHKTDQCWVESVVVFKSERGKGYGRILMEKTEKYAKNLGFNVVYLSTHDKHDFYARLGYSVCPPILNVGANAFLLNNPQFENFTKKLTDDNFNHQQTDKVLMPPIDVEISSVNKNSPLPPPPPPVLKNNANVTNQIYMKKIL